MKKINKKESTFLKQLPKQALKASAIIVSIILVTACSDNNNDSMDHSIDDSTDDNSSTQFPIASNVVGAYTISASGGKGNSLGNGRGGYGNNIYILLKDGMGGRLEILNYGSVDASFSTPSITTDTGTSGEIISSDTTISVSTTEPVVDVLYMISDDTRLYKSDGNGTIGETSEIVSGLTVDANTTLTLALNMTSPAANLEFTDDIINNGTITTAANGTATGDLMLWAKNIVTNSGSTITTAGMDATVVDGGTISLQADRIISNTGSLNSSGYTDTSSTIDGGNAGSIAMTSIEGTYNIGTLSAMGGAADGTGNNGGDGGTVSLTTQYDDLNNAGTINTDGGNADVTPGNGGMINLEVSNMGDLYNTANLTTMGGNSTTDSGGSAGGIIVKVNGGGIKTSGDLTTTGGTAADDGMTGGDGGVIFIHTEWGDFGSMPGNILISGNLNTNGGDISADVIGGGTGGMAGHINVRGNRNNRFAAPQLIGFWGYTSITTNGGEGESGQTAGTFIVHSEESQVIASDGTHQQTNPSSIINYANISLKGGNSTSTTIANKRGGMGGSVDFHTDGIINGEQTIFNAGDIVTSSGSNHQRVYGAITTSGSIVMTSSGGITNSGNLTTDAGDDDGTASQGAGNDSFPGVLPAANGTVNNSGIISTLGGNGVFSGGAGGDITITAASIINTANFTTSGGNAEATLTASIGGDAGKISFTAKSSTLVSDSGTHTHNGGTGETAGNDPVVHSLANH